jgi:hypothetical protein
VLDDRFCNERFVAATDGERVRLGDELAQELTRRVQASADPAQETYECIEDLKRLGHDLWSFDESDDFQLWCADWTRPTKQVELFVEFVYRQNERPSVTISTRGWEHQD